METMGLRLVFKRIPKQRKDMVLNVMAKIVPPRLFEPKTNIREIMGRFDELPMMYNAALDDYNRGNGKMMAGFVMCKKVGEEDDDTESRNDIIDVDCRES
jgi:hypothetical protein